MAHIMYVPELKDKSDKTIDLYLHSWMVRVFFLRWTTLSSKLFAL